MEEASYYAVNLDELMDKVGARIAELLGAESAIVTAGCAAALAHAAAACVAGADPEKMQQLPELTGLKDRMIMPRQSRNAYDHAFRSVGVEMMEVDTREEFHAALTERVALVAVLGTGEPRGKIRLEEMVEAAHQRGIPVIVDAAAELPVKPNPYLSRGADLVAYSGGKFLRGPQCAGILAGRRDLVRAAWLNSSPHHAFGRSMKVGKEEIMGMLAAIERWKKYDLQAEYRMWEGWYQAISEKITRIAGVTTKVMPPAGASPYPVMEVAWDRQRIPLTSGEVGSMLLDGEPRIMSHAEGEGHSFVIRPVAMKAGEYKQVADRLAAVLGGAPKARPEQTEAPAADVTGEWEVEVRFAVGSARHRLRLRAEGNAVRGTHSGSRANGEVRGRVEGNRVSLRSSLPCEGTRLTYAFRGTLEGGRMSGDVDLGEYGTATWQGVKG
jgi:L-seryl-tRNA(Ser) seleniumtransferase